MDANQALWDVIREETKTGFGEYAGGGSREWTRIRTKAAKMACRRFAEFSERDVEVGTELRVKGGKYRLDVYAREKGSIAEEFFVALETELAPWGYNGPSEKDWRKAFRRLCFVKAEFRVVMGTFEGTGGSFDQKLPGYLDTLKAEFDAREPGRFLLAFGPSLPRKCRPNRGGPSHLTPTSGCTS